MTSIGKVNKRDWDSFDVKKILTYKMELFDVFFTHFGLSDF